MGGTRSGLRVNRLRLAAALALALVLASPALAGEVLVRPEVDLRAAPSLALSVEAKPGDTIRVELPVQAGTGYRWTADVAGDAVAAGAPSGAAASGGELGGPAVQVFGYRATGPGRADLAFRYRRPWLPPEEAVGHVGVMVTVLP